MNSSGALGAAIRALKSGDKARSQQLLAPILQADPRNERAWLLMAAALENPVRERECLQRALGLNPTSKLARQMLTELDKAAMFSSAPSKPASPSVSPSQPDGNSLRAALLTEGPLNSGGSNISGAEALSVTPTARVGDALSDGLLAGLISGVFVLIVPVIAMSSGNATLESFYIVFGMGAALLLPFIGGLVAGYMYSRRRPNINKNHFAVAGGLAGVLSGTLSGLLIGMFLAFTSSEAPISLSGSSAILTYLALCGLAPAGLGLGIGAIGAMLFGSFVPKKESVQVNEDPDTFWNRYKRVGGRTVKSRLIGFGIAAIIIFLCNFCSSLIN